MEITYLGHSSFKLRGRQVTVVTDPFNPEMVGLEFPKLEAEIVTISHQHEDHNFLGRIGSETFLLKGPGEYEVKGVRIIGISTFHDHSSGGERGKNTVYRIELDGLSLVHAGDLGHKLSEKERELLNGIDILFVPVGGLYTLCPKEAAEVVSQLEPRMIIPMHYHRPELNQNIFGKLENVGVFLKEMGKEGVKPVPKLSISKDKLPAELTVVVLES